MRIKKALKILGIIFLITTISAIAFGVYFYQTTPMLKAIANNDESKLFYFPSKKMMPMDDLKYDENPLLVEDTIVIQTYQFEPTTEPKANLFLAYGGGGNVTTYQNMIKTLVDNGFTVYAFDYRGFGKSNGKPSYKGVIQDTRKAFSDFISRSQENSLKKGRLWNVIRWPIGG